MLGALEHNVTELCKKTVYDKKNVLQWVYAIFD